MKNHYEILELEHNASSEEIDKAYKNLSKEFHPDNNGGVKYFDDLFIQIRNAYQVLSEEKLREHYDREKGFIEANVIEDDLKNVEPEILLFEVDKNVFEEGDEIILTWETKNADNVVLIPFGEMETSGSKIYRLKNYNESSLTLILEVTNTVSGKRVKNSLQLLNKVTEIDFSILNNQKTQETKKGETKESLDNISFSPESATLTSQEEVTESFFSSRGRLRRKTYLMRLLLLAVPTALIYVMLEESSNFYGYDQNTLIFSGLVLIVISYFSILQFIKRLHDINLSGWWVLFSLIPYVGGLFGLVLIFIDSSKGPNKYGDDPKRRL